MWDPFQRIVRIAEAVDSAPSIFNTRPWYLRPVPPDRVEMRFDPRALGGGDYGPGDLGGRREYDGRRDRWAAPGSLLRPDPLIREEMISCGAALYNLRLAIRVAGHGLAVWMLPDVRRDASLLASVEIMVGRLKPPTPDEEELYEAIWLRHTSREPYKILPVPMPLLVEMEEAALAERGWLRIVHRHQARQLLRDAAYAGDVLKGIRRLDIRPVKGESEDEARQRRADIEGRLARFQQQRDLVNNVSDGGSGPRPENTAFPPTRRDFWKDPPGRFEHWRRLWYHQWPWWWYPEVPQMVLRVGYIPVEPLPAPSDPGRQTWQTAAPPPGNDGLSGAATIRSG